MAIKRVLDTHALVWYLEGNPRLGRKAKAVMDQPESELVLPLIALAEAAYLIERRRIAIPSISDLMADVASDPRIEIYPLSLDVFERSLSPEGLHIPELHDRFIVSTALYLLDAGYEASIITCDRTITDAGILPVLW